ncbi:hypothetical protein ACFL21_02065 [Patescibacteria group bacterium]
MALEKLPEHNFEGTVRTQLGLRLEDEPDSDAFQVAVFDVRNEYESLLFALLEEDAKENEDDHFFDKHALFIHGAPVLVGRAMIRDKIGTIIKRILSDEKCDRSLNIQVPKPYFGFVENDSKLMFFASAPNMDKIQGIRNFFRLHAIKSLLKCLNMTLEELNEIESPKPQAPKAPIVKKKNYLRRKSRTRGR